MLFSIAFFSEKALEQFWLALPEGSNSSISSNTNNYNYN